MSMDDKILSHFFPWVKGNKQPGKWVVMFMDPTNKDDRIIPKKALISEKAVADLTKSKTADFNKALKEVEGEYKEEVVSKHAEPKDDDTWKTFTDAMKEVAKGGDPCFGVVEYKQKIFFVSYCDDETVPVKKKMKFSGVRQKLKGKLTGCAVDLQCTSAGELDQAEFDKKVKKV